MNLICIRTKYRTHIHTHALARDGKLGSFYENENESVMSGNNRDDYFRTHTRTNVRILTYTHTHTQINKHAHIYIYRRPAGKADGLRARYKNTHALSQIWSTFLKVDRQNLDKKIDR